MAIDVKVVTHLFDQESVPAGHAVVVVANLKSEWERLGFKTGVSYLVPKSMITSWRFGTDIPESTPAVAFAGDPRESHWTDEAIRDWQNRNIKTVRDHNANSTNLK